MLHRPSPELPYIGQQLSAQRWSQLQIVPEFEFADDGG